MWTIKPCVNTCSHPKDSELIVTIGISSALQLQIRSISPPNSRISIRKILKLRVHKKSALVQSMGPRYQMRQQLSVQQKIALRSSPTLLLERDSPSSFLTRVTLIWETPMLDYGRAHRKEKTQAFRSRAREREMLEGF